MTIVWIENLFFIRSKCELSVWFSCWIMKPDDQDSDSGLCLELGLSCASRWCHITTLSQTQVKMLFVSLLCHKFTFHLFLLFQGANTFAAKINIEVQRASEGAIAAIERNGGVITTGFYDPISLGN